MIVVDSSGWIEYFTDGPLAATYEPYIVEPDAIATPTLVLFEVFKVIKRESGEEAALLAAAQLSQTELLPLSESLALAAADISLEHRLAMADAIVYASALAQGANLITSDADFEGLPHVQYFSRNR